MHVASLPSSYTSEQLSDLFSDIGPIKSAFVVTEKAPLPDAAAAQASSSNATPVAHTAPLTSRRFGFVKFVLQEDAERAISDLNGLSLSKEQGGTGNAASKLKVTWANRRLREGDGSTVKPALPAQAKPKWKEIKAAEKVRLAQVATADPAAIPSTRRDPKCTIVVRGLAHTLPSEEVAPDVDDLKKTLYKKAKKLVSVMPGVHEQTTVDLEYPVASDTTNDTGVHNSLHLSHCL